MEDLPKRTILGNFDTFNGLNLFHSRIGMLSIPGQLISKETRQLAARVFF